jgi:hypothetical protein
LPGDPGSDTSEDSLLDETRLKGDLEKEETIRIMTKPYQDQDLEERNKEGFGSSEEDDDGKEAQAIDSLTLEAVTSIAQDLVARIANENIADEAGCGLLGVEQNGGECSISEGDPLPGSQNPQKRGRGRPRKPVPPPAVQTCANCNAPSEETNRRIYFRESLPILITIREEGEGEGRAERKREVIVYDALVDIFQLRWKPAQSKLLNVAMESELFVCEDCATRLAHLYEEYNEFSQLALR